MALNKQPVAINFARGLDTKSDPFQVPVGNFLSLTNSVFTASGRLTKRNGFRNITSLPNTDQTVLTTLNDNLIATGSHLYAFSKDTDMWLNQGLIQPVQLAVQSLVRSSTKQTGADSAVASNGLVCTAYMDTGVAYYQISDSTTGQQIRARTSLGTASADPRVTILGPWFIVTYIIVIAATPTLKFVAIPTMDPTSPKAAITISANVNSSTAGYDAKMYGNRLYVAWGESGSAVGIVFINQALVVSTVEVIAGNTADLVSITVDEGTRYIWISYWEQSSGDGYSVAYNTQLNQLVTPTQIIAATQIAEITSLATLGVLTVFYQNINNYSYTDLAGDAIRWPPLLRRNHRRRRRSCHHRVAATRSRWGRRPHPHHPIGEAV